MATRTATRIRPHGVGDLSRLPGLARLDEDYRWGMQAAARVLPFRVNDHVLEHLIDWDRVPEDPLFQLAFPQPGMLRPDELADLKALLRRGDEAGAQRRAEEIQRGRNPHPAGQLDQNAVWLDGRRLPGMQHKYDETVLFFPAPGQTCHTWCTYCFRWPQFVGLPGLKMASSQVSDLVAYLEAHPEVTDVLFTGGDPMVMTSQVLRRFVEPLLSPRLAHVRNLRIGTKSLAWWPQRFVSDADADDVLRLFEEVIAAGRHLAVNAHYTHPRELAPTIAREAVARVRSTGAVIRSQAPVVRHINDDAALWRALWTEQVRLGIVPYYFFIERDTGARHYFEVPLVEAHRIFRSAWAASPGLARTVRGPSMSATPGKIRVVGRANRRGEDVFVLEFLQGRNPSWVGRPFFAAFDPQATWFDQLRPAFGQTRFFFEDEPPQDRFRDHRPPGATRTGTPLPLAGEPGVGGGSGGPSVPPPTTPPITPPITA